MADNPKYVRLVMRLSRSHVGDVQGGSGWSISGLHVKPFPEVTERASDKTKAAAKFVTNMLRRGVLEAASSAEYEEVMAAQEDMEALAEKTYGKAKVTPEAPRKPIQESTIREKTEERRNEMLENRGLSEEGLTAAVRGDEVDAPDLDDLKAADIVKGLKDGSLDPEVVREYEEGRDGDPRKSVIEAVEDAEADEDDDEDE